MTRPAFKLLFAFGLLILLESAAKTRADQLPALPTHRGSDREGMTDSGKPIDVWVPYQAEFSSVSSYLESLAISQRGSLAGYRFPLFNQEAGTSQQADEHEPPAPNNPNDQRLRQAEAAAG